MVKHKIVGQLFYKTVQWESVLGVLGNMDCRHYCVRKYSAE